MSTRPPRRPDVTGLDLVGGPEPLTVTLAEHDPRWAEAFREHRARILAALAGQDVDVEHIGSTSVPGLAAKPVVDLVVVVDDVTAEEDYLDPLLAAGYVLRVREPGHRLVRTPERDVHVHVYGRGDRAVEEYLLLRDHLRRDESDRRLYESVKRDLVARRWEDTNDYADAKTEVITAIKERARAARGVRHVLFVCVRNGGKSQMAAGLARRAFAEAGLDVAVSSAGTAAGTTLNAQSVESLLEVGVDVTAEVPRQLTEDDVRSADLVVVLGAEAHVEPLGDTPVEVWETDEPSARGVEGLERMRLVRDDIAARITGLVERLRR
ncbi:hypothetical protein GCM10027519_25150 [Kineococcus endophyticus]